VEYAIELLDNGKILAAVARLLGVERIPRLWRLIKSRCIKCYWHQKQHVHKEFVVWCVTPFVV
jgi:hypothetical protein